MVDEYAFHNPEEAYQIGIQLLMKEDWKILQKYYDLDGSGVDPKELSSGSFLRTIKANMWGHQVLSQHTKNPFHWDLNI